MAQAVAVPARQSIRIEEIRFLVFGRSLPAVLFAVLGYRVLLNLIAQVRGLPAHAGFLALLGGPLPTALYFFFCAIPVAIYLTRARPRARDGRLVARAAALAGTTMLLVVGAFPSRLLFTPPAVVSGAATPITIAAFALGVYGLLYLRRNLSIIPEARRLVTGGPYRVVRHPLYAAEILAATGLVLASPGLWATVALPGFIAIQLIRARFEERLLSGTFPEYSEYSRHTRRLVPLVW